MMNSFILCKSEFEIQPGFERGSSDCQLDALTTELLELWHWSRGWDILYPLTVLDLEGV